RRRDVGRSGVATITRRDANPASRMDPSVSPLSGLVQALASSQRLRAFADGFPADARVSEPALPLVLAALHRELARPLVCLLAADEAARYVEAAARRDSDLRAR